MKSKSLFFVLLLLLVVSLSFAAAGFFSDIWNKIMGKSITGKAIDHNTGLMAYWKFDENSGKSAADSSKNDNAGIISGAVWATGKSRSALKFDGVNDSIKIPDSNSLDLNDSFTLMAWIYSQGSGAEQEIIYKINPSPTWVGYHFDLRSGASDMKLRCMAHNTTSISGNITSDGALAKNKWHLVACVRNTASGTLSLYVGGSQAATPATDNTVNMNIINNVPLYIGSSSGSTRYFNGSIDEVMIFNRALTGHEISDYYNSFLQECTDSDGDGYNQSKTGCGIVDCNDNSVLIGECSGCTVCEITTIGIGNGECIFGIPKPVMSKYENSITTNLTNKNLLNNISNFTIGILGVSNIEFTDNVKLFRNISGVCEALDFDSYINISAGKVDIDSENLPELNKSAIITMYNINLISPYITIDGQKCIDCEILNYMDNILVFNVTHFTTYEVRGCGDGICDSDAGEICGATDNAPECNTDCSTCPAPPVPPGNGGGDGAPPYKNFSLSIDDVSFKLSQGESKSVSFSITNTGDSSSNFNINSNLEEISFSENIFSLAKGGSKTVNINVNLGENKSYGIYVGKIYIKSGSMTKEISVSIEVVSADSLFDIVLIIPDEYLSVLPGENILGEVTLTKLSGLSGINSVVLNYIIEDEYGNILLSENEQKDIEETSTSINKEFLIPKEEEYGKHVLYVQLKYEEKVASASKWFNVGTKSKLVGVMFWFVVVVVILIISIAFFILVIYLKDIKKDYEVIKKES